MILSEIINIIIQDSLVIKMPQDRRMTRSYNQNTQILRTYDLESSDRISFSNESKIFKINSDIYSLGKQKQKEEKLSKFVLRVHP